MQQSSSILHVCKAITSAAHGRSFLSLVSVRQMSSTTLKEPAPIDGYQYIFRIDGMCGGKPVFNRQRMPVKLLYGRLKNGATVEELNEDYTDEETKVNGLNLTAEAAEEIIHYGDTHSEEMKDKK